MKRPLLAALALSLLAAAARAQNSTDRSSDGGGAEAPQAAPAANGAHDGIRAAGVQYHVSCEKGGEAVFKKGVPHGDEVKFGAFAHQGDQAYDEEGRKNLDQDKLAALPQAEQERAAKLAKEKAYLDDCARSADKKLVEATDPAEKAKAKGAKKLLVLKKRLVTRKIMKFNSTHNGVIKRLAPAPGEDNDESATPDEPGNPDSTPPQH